MGNSSAHDAAPSQANVQESGPVLMAPEYASAVYQGYGDSSSYSQSSNTLQVNDGDKGMGLRASSMLGPAIDVNSRMLPTVFRYGGGGKSVEISGSFVEWKSNIPLVRSRNDFFTIIDLPEGIHEFKYLVDGEWVCDNKQDKVPNPMGTENNRIEVKSSDFEVFEALGIDCTDTGHSDGLGLLKRNKQPGSPPGEYAQIMPPKDAVRRHGPPILPGHLLQFLLNQEIASHCEPTLLPEPNHVMLNHLYALSIKDGVMVLSTTHRYRKKYITTLLYKPIP